LTNTEESDELEILSMPLKKYEVEYYPIPKPFPLEAIKFRMGTNECSRCLAIENSKCPLPKSEILLIKKA
jgi:HTH-type transcriptional regulator/antitoxin HigA